MIQQLISLNSPVSDSNFQEWVKGWAVRIPVLAPNASLRVPLGYKAQWSGGNEFYSNYNCLVQKNYLSKN